MFEALIEVINRGAAIVTASLVNTLPVTILGVTGAILAAGSKRWSASTRYCLWWLILVFVIATPIVWALFAGAQSTPTNQVSITSLRSAAPIDYGINVGTSNAAKHGRQTGPTAPASPWLSFAAIFLCCWALATAVQAAGVVRGFLHGLRLKRSSSVPQLDLEGMFDRLRLRLAIRRPVRISISSELSSPAVVGYLSPQIMVPAGLVSRLSLREMEQILMHELAHVARYDDWSIAVQRLVEAATICHPLVRYVAHRLNLDREMACDDRVAETHDRGCYAECLAKVAQMNSSSFARAVLVPLVERKSELLERVEVLLDSTRTHLPQVSIPRLLAACAGFIVLGAVGLRAPKLVAMPLPAASLSPINQQTTHEEQRPAPAISPSKSSEHSQPSINSIIVTSEDGSSSTFGSWSGYPSDAGGRQPGTIEFRSDNKIYVVRDKGTLAEAQKTLQPMEELGRQQSQLGEKQSTLGKVQSFLGEEQQKVAEQPLDAPTQTKLAEKLQALKGQIDEVNAKHLAERANDVQAQLAKLQAELAEMQSEMGSVEGRLGEQQGLLGQKQGKLGEQQAELGKQQAELGEQQAIESKRVEKKLRELIRNAQSHGLAEPVR